VGWWSQGLKAVRIDGDGGHLATGVASGYGTSSQLIRKMRARIEIPVYKAGAVWGIG